MSEYPRVILKSGKDQSLHRRHPWIFSGAIKKIKDGEPADGDLVTIYDNKDQYLGTGHYQIGSIAIRILTFENEEINDNFFRKKFKMAWEYRQYVQCIDPKNTNIFRFIHAEGDSLPGLIIDFYNGIAVMQMHSIGMYRIRHLFVRILQEIFGSDLKAVYDKSSSTLPFKANINPEDEFLFGNAENIISDEHGYKFKINWSQGQKTGFFIDQRENRKLLERYCPNKNVLNVFGYTGGFSVYAMGGGAKTVHTVDSSKHAIELARENVALNFPDHSVHEEFATDAFKYLEDIDQKYDVIILDPPAFAKHGNVLPNALQGYKRINARAISQIKPGGILFTFSCSQVVSKENFRKSIFTAAANTGRSVRILHQLGQPLDHPVNIYHPESEYLKGLVLYVE